MKATEFVYWLQGYFEINGAGNDLTQAQAQAVFKKAESAKSGQGDVEEKAQEFVKFADRILYPTTLENFVDAKYLKTATQELKAKLNDLFIHAIDPSYDGDQNQLNQTHNGGPKPPLDYGPGWRC